MLIESVSYLVVPLRDEIHVECILIGLNSWRGCHEGCFPNLWKHWFLGTVEWPASAYRHAGYSDGLPVVDVSCIHLFGLTRAAVADSGNSYDSFKVFLGLPTTGGH
jgi:hypothetical protein